MSAPQGKPSAFPSRIPLEKPTDRPLSAATQRVYDMWTPKQDTGNPFYTIFKYSRVTGIGRTIPTCQCHGATRPKCSRLAIPITSGIRGGVPNTSRSDGITSTAPATRFPLLIGIWRIYATQLRKTASIGWSRALPCRARPKDHTATARYLRPISLFSRALLPLLPDLHHHVARK